MARGRQKGVASLKDTVLDSEIVRRGEVRNEPNYVLPDGNYGISGKYADYSLMTKRLAYRTGSEEDGEDNSKVIEYTMWEDYPCYSSTLEGIFKSYAKILNLTEFKSKKLTNDIRELIDIHSKTQEIINTALLGLDTFISSKETEICNLNDTLFGLKTKVTEANKVLEGYKKLIHESEAEFKAARTIIVDNMPKEKKHRLKLEDN